MKGQPFCKIEGHSDLYRDKNTGALLFVTPNKRAEKAMLRAEKVDASIKLETLYSDMQEMKLQIAELIELVRNK